jgi:nuclear transport factor 2 (NTF2) superfamily protein
MGQGEELSVEEGAVCVYRQQDVGYSVIVLLTLVSAVEFWYEYSETEDPSSQWYRTYGLEHWVFAEDGRMKSRQVGTASLNQHV